MYIIDSLALSSEPTALVLIPEQSLTNTCIFSWRHNTAVVCSGTLGSTSALSLEMFYTKSPIKNPKMQKNMALNRSPERTLIYSMMFETRRQSVTFSSAGNMHVLRFKIFTTLCMSMKDCENGMSIDFGHYKHVFVSRLGKFQNTGFTSNDDGLYLQRHSKWNKYHIAGYRHPCFVFSLKFRQKLDNVGESLCEKDQNMAEVWGVDDF